MSHTIMPFIRKRLRTTAALAGTLALSACLLPPKEPPRPAELSSAQLGLAGAEIPAAQDAWWQAYGDPQLDALVANMLKENPILADAMTRIRSAQAQAAATGAALLPQASVDGAATREHFPEHSLYPYPLAGGEYWQSALNAELAWDLDLFGRHAALLEQAKSEARAAALDAAAAHLVLSGALSQAYVDLYRGYALADIAERSEQQRLRILELTRKRVAAGLDTQQELHESEVTVPQARLARLQAEAGVDAAIHKLAALSNRGADFYAGIHRPRIDIETALPLPDRLPANLLAHRPDVIGAQWRVNAALAGRQAAHQAFYPNVNLSAFAGLQAIGLANLVETSSRTYGAGPALYLPLFDGGKLNAGYQAASAKVDSAIAAYNQTVLYAVQQVADQLSKVESYRRQLMEARAAAEAAEQGYQIAERRYAAGLSTQLSVLNAETQVLNSQRAVVDALAGQSIARVSLLLALGGSFSPPPALVAPPVVTAAAP
jgi:NodT family efflux transporter outer membrane factor (OMF) lipoprotein